MGVSHRTLDYDDPVFLGWAGVNGLGPTMRGARNGGFASATALQGNRGYFLPIRVFKPYPLRRFFWLNGATTGTGWLMMGLYDDSLTHIATSQRVLTSGTNAVQYSEPGIGVEANSTPFSLSTDLSTYTTNSVTMKKGLLHIVAVENSHGTSATAVNSITATGGGSPTFTSRSTTQFNSSLNRTSIWSCVPTADYTGTLDVDFGGVTQTGVHIFTYVFVGVDTTTDDGIVQQATGTGNDTTPTVTLSAFGSARNGVFAAHGTAANAAVTPETNWVELFDAGIPTPAQSLETQWRADNDTTATATITSAPWGSCAIEVKSLVAPILIPAGLHYIALHSNVSTDAFFQLSSANSDIVPGPTEQSAMPVLGRLLVPIGSAANRFPVCGFTRRSTP